MLIGTPATADDLAFVLWYRWLARNIFNVGGTLGFGVHGLGGIWALNTESAALSKPSSRLSGQVSGNKVRAG